jgi:DNA-binding helix-hairpin-helix protein with protein kinase domain
VSGLYRKQQRIQRKLKSESNNVFNGNSRAEATTYSTETQERKQYMTFKEAQQRLQEQQKVWKRTLKSGRKHEADTQERRTIILEFTEQVS